MTKRSIAAFAVLVIWLATVGWHVRREYFGPPELRMAAGARTLAPGTHFYVVRMDGNAIGYASTRFDTTSTGYRFSDMTILDVPTMGQVQRATTQSSVEFGSALEMRSFEFTLGSAIGAFRASGELRDSTMSLRIRAGGDEQRSSLQVSPDVTLDAATALRLAAADALEVGRSVSVPIFDPSAMTTRMIAVEVTAQDTITVPDSVRWDAQREDWEITVYDTVPVWRLDQRFGGVSVQTWVDPSGQIVRSESPLGFTMERTTFELARREFEAARARTDLATGYGAIIESTAIASNVDVSDVEWTPRLDVRLRDVDLEGYDLEGGRQTLRGDTLTITREDFSALRAGYSLPYRGGGEPADELSFSPLIPDDPRIRAKAREIVGDTRDPAEAARLLNEWVYDNVRKEITLSVPSAPQVLESLRGDCNEHTVLYVALARSLGLPTRTAAGLVSLEGRFFYHAWPEVWLGEWVAVDPTLGQYPADASHLRFVIGGLARQVELVRLIGRLRLEVL